MRITDRRDWRRALARELTRQSHFHAEEILADCSSQPGSAQRVGITGAPGTGKSSLISQLAERRLRRGRSVGVLAIDPTSPVSQGALLGDRIRMDAVADDDGIFIRSVASGTCHDGLCRNVVGLLNVLDSAGFDDVVLETVGIGQINYDARTLVDSFVLTLIPGSGDVVQAMKAGIMELADIYVVNKADIAGADKLASELGSLVHWRGQMGGWTPRVVMTSMQDGRGLEELDASIDAHHASRTADRSRSDNVERRGYQLRALVIQHLHELSERGAIELGDDLKRSYLHALEELHRSASRSHVSERSSRS